MAFSLFSRSYKFLTIYVAVSSLAVILVGMFELAFSQGQLQPYHLPWAFMVVGQLYLWKMQVQCETLTHDLGWASSLFLFQGIGVIWSSIIIPIYLVLQIFINCAIISEVICHRLVDFNRVKAIHNSDRIKH